LAGSEDYSYGFLLPLVSLYVIYTKLPEIRRNAWQPSWTGLAVIFVGFCLYIFGELAADLFIPRISFIVVLTGILILIGGWAVARLFAFPLLLLFLMLPLPGFIIKQLTIPLQLVSSQLATWLLQTFGVPAVRYGNVIDLGVRQLQVVAACSGLRYILALIALGVIFCYFYQRHFWKAAILVSAVIPAAIIANALRVAGMGVFPTMQEGFWHGFSGWLIFVFCFACLGFLNLLLNRLWPRPESAPVRIDSPPAAGPVPSRLPHLLAALALIVVAGPLVWGLSQVSAVPLKQPLANFPLDLGPWKGQHVFVDPKIIDTLKCDDHLSLEFRHPANASVSLWMAYYENQQKSMGVHSPFACLQGGGWQILESGITEVAPGSPVNSLLMEYLGERQLVYYWFIQRGRWMTSEYLGKFLMGYDRLINRRADGVLVRLVTPTGQDVKAARERLTTFARLLIPVLPRFISLAPKPAAPLHIDKKN
jgi:exosortase D (VPLPA-CTERM-specific)